MITYQQITTPEGSSFKYSGNLVQDDGKTPIPNGSLLTLTLTITDANTGSIINSRNKTNVLNANGVTVDVTSNPATGLLTWKASPADNPVISVSANDGDLERHIAIFEWTWSDGTNTLTNQRKVLIDVEKYANTESPIEVGTGLDTVTISLNDVNNNPIVAADVWVTSDAGGLTRVSGTLQTDRYGKTSFKLTNGSTYYLWMQKVGTTPINGQSFVAVKD